MFIVILLGGSTAYAGKKLFIINYFGENGYHHPSQPSAVRLVEQIAALHHWEVLSTADGSVFTEKTLSRTAMIVFNNNCGNDGQLLGRTAWLAIRKFIEKGGSFTGIHCAGAIWHEENEFQNWYESLIGARMTAHPPEQKATMLIETMNHPATAHLPARWVVRDEYHSFSVNPRNSVKVLISADETTYTGTPKMGGDHPLVWCRELKGSRMFFTSLGHNVEIYADSNYIKMLEGGLVWAARKERFPAGLPVKNGLLVDMDADKGVFLDDSLKVMKWENQAGFTRAGFFEKRDSGRLTVGSGCPRLRRRVNEINGHNSIVFEEQELLNQEEETFDHLTTGSGYTFFCILSPFKQRGKLKDVNSFLGNLRNGGNYEGFWAGLSDDNHFWTAPRNGITIGRWDNNNPYLRSSAALKENNFVLLMGKMDAGSDSANIYLMINQWNEHTAQFRVKVNIKANPSKLSIGQERDAVQHPGFESFDGEIARLLLFERPLTEKEMKAVIKHLISSYHIKAF